MASRKKKFAVLISGRGSNMAALLKAAQSSEFSAEPILVISNKADAPGLQTAKSSGIPTNVVSHRDFENRENFDAALTSLLLGAEVDFICLAGFMRIFSQSFVDQWYGKLINIHPALLPSFPGLDVQQKAIDAGVRFSGCTVHFVDGGMDTGPIIGQSVVPLLPDDSADSLAARILEQEHRLYPRCLSLLAEGKIWLEEDKVFYATDFRRDQSLSLP